MSRSRWNSVGRATPAGVHCGDTVTLSRRSALALTSVAALTAAARPVGALASEHLLPAIIRKIPSTGEQMPVVGIGTNAYDVSSPEEVAARREVLRAMPGLGARLIDTARGYGRSEEVVGSLLAELGNRDRFFVATKPVSAPQAKEPVTRAVIEESFTRLQTRRVDLGAGRGRLPDATLRQRMERLWADL